MSFDLESLLLDKVRNNFLEKLDECMCAHAHTHTLCSVLRGISVKMKIKRRKKNPARLFIPEDASWNRYTESVCERVRVCVCFLGHYKYRTFYFAYGRNLFQSFFSPCACVKRIVMK